MKRLFRIFVLVLITICCSKLSFGITGTGLEVFYRWTQDSTYEFTVVAYRQCVGGIILPGPVPSSVIWVYYKSSADSGYFSCSILPSSGNGVPSLKPKNMFNCTSYPWCEEEYVYRGTWTSPKKANDWVFSVNFLGIPSPPYALVNLIDPVSGPGATHLHVDCGLNNLDFPDTLNKNISPIFHNRRPSIHGHLMDTVRNPPNKSVCVGRNVKLSQQVRNYDNDQIVYEFYHPQSRRFSHSFAPMSYINGYSFTNPLPSRNGPIQIDSLSGMVSFIPDSAFGLSLYLLGIKATEYRLDTGNVLKEIGFVKRTLVISIEDSSNCMDLDYSYQDTVTWTDTSQIELKCDDNPFSIALSEYVQCNSIDSNGSHILLLNATTLDTIKISKSYSRNCSTKSLTRIFSVYLDSVLEVGTYYLMLKKGSDGNSLMTECFMELPAFQDTLTIVVSTSPPHGELRTSQFAGAEDTLIMECRESEFDVYLTRKALCNSIASDGSDFVLLDQTVFPPKKIPLRSAYSVTNCAQEYTQKIKITALDPMDPGPYELILVNGSDGNSLRDACFHNWDSSSISISVKDISVRLGPDFEYCKDTELDTVLDAGKFAAYNWSTGSHSQSISVDTAGIYWVLVFTNSGCSKADTIEIREKDCTVGIALEGYSNCVKIYPNPTGSIVNITFESTQRAIQLELIEIHGTVLKTWNFYNTSEETVDISQYPDGIYLFKAVTKDRIGTVRVVKSR